MKFNQFVFSIVFAVLSSVSFSANARYNVSLNQPAGFARNGIQLGRALEKYWGADSLISLLDHKNVLYLKAAVDSVGYISELEDVRVRYNIVDKDGGLTFIHLTDKQLSELEQILIDNKYIFSIGYEFIDGYSDWDILKDKLCNDFDKLNYDNKTAVFTFPGGYKKLYTDNHAHYIRYITNSLTAYRTSIYSIINNPTDTRDCDVANLNEAVFLLSMIYAFGDYRVNRWLDDFKFEMVLSIDDQGYVNAIKTIEGNSPLNEVDQQVLLDFMKYNKVRYSHNAGALSKDLIEIKFPGRLGDNALQLKNFLHRMHSLEEEVRGIVRSTENSIYESD